ncbi:MAG: sigma-70 family RNA polymerase sigma factor [Phycisphaerae bacterium]|nr:sigma-70 family RNA polymerase sigma factor [Phycisphaerae bacterium]
MDDDLETIVVGGAQRGDQDAWARLFDWHFDGVYRYCLRLAWPRQDLAEEVVQETFMVAAGRIHRFRPSAGTFRTWLLGIARKRWMKLCTAEVRRRGREREHQARIGEARADTRDRVLAVLEALAKLPPGYRAILEVKYMGGLTVSQIARQEGTSEDAAESLLRRARDRFGQVYKEMERG